MPSCDLPEIPDFSKRMPRFGFLGEFLPAETSSDYIRHLSDVREIFTAAGAEVVDLKAPPSFKDVAPSHTIIFDAELTHYHWDLFESRRDDYPPGIRERIEAGKTISGSDYVEAIRKRRIFQTEMIEILSSVDAAFMNASVTTAPFSLASTGSPAANVPWSFAGFPALSLPSGMDLKGLPFGVQVIGLPGHDDHLAAVGAWCEKALGFSHSPAD
jgi:Asp-tRNA(Asn)/Glu-tRNA(Gln) amidotransferase A subunit family amidase